MPFPIRRDLRDSNSEIRSSKSELQISTTASVVGTLVSSFFRGSDFAPRNLRRTTLRPEWPPSGVVMSAALDSLDFADTLSRSLSRRMPVASLACGPGP